MLTLKLLLMIRNQNEREMKTVVRLQKFENRQSSIHNIYIIKYYASCCYENSDFKVCYVFGLVL